MAMPRPARYIPAPEGDALMPVTVPTQDAFAALEARVAALETAAGGQPPPGGGTQPPLPGIDPVNPYAPPAPPKPAIMPGTSGRVLTCGPGQQYATAVDAIAAAQDGDTVRLTPGMPRETFEFHVAILLDGAGNSWDFRDLSSGQLAWGKACLVPNAAAWHIRNFTISGCGISESSSTMVSGIRCDLPGWGVVEGCRLTGNQVGLGIGGEGQVIELIDSKLEDNGLGDGLSHNIYCGTAHTLRLTRVTSKNSREGHAVKSRAWHTYLSDCWIGGKQTLVDLPNGGAFRVLRSTLHKADGSTNGRIVGYAEENADMHVLADNSFEGCVMDLACGRPTFIQTLGGRMTFDTKCQWTLDGPVTVEGSGSVVGLPAAL